MDNNSCCLICSFFPTYKHKSSIQFIMKRHNESKGHKLRVKLNALENQITEEIVSESRAIYKKEKQIIGFQIEKKDCIIHFKL